MQAVIAVTGKDYVGIIADVSQECKRFKVNISDVSQTVLKDYFVMIMLMDLKDLEEPFSDFSDAMKELEEPEAWSFTPCTKIFLMHKI